MSGLTDAGFETRRTDEIEDSILDSVESAYGPIDRTDAGVIRQFVGIIAERLGLLWEEAAAIYASYYPSSAEGASLDDVAELTGLQRIAADESTATIGAEGTAATVIPSGTQFSSSTTGDVFESDAAQTIEAADSVQDVIEVTTADNTQTFTITINGTDYDFVSDASATKQEIVTGLIAALSTGSAPMTGVDDGTGDSLTLTANDGKTGYNVTVSATGAGVLTITEIWSPVAVTAQVAGEKLVNAGQIDTIVTPVAGMNQVEQFADGVEGRETETDAELRVRIVGARLGYSTVEAIRSRVADEVDGVSTVIVIENPTDGTVDGRPPHSFETIVEGGTDQDIGEKIWELKPAGIQTYGSSSVTVVDGAGNNQTVYFSRPTSQYAWVQVIYTKYDEETFPADGEDSIADDVLEYGGTFEIGQDLLWQRFLTPVFNTAGVKSAQIKLAITATPGGTPSYVTDTDVAIDEDELAVFDATRITVSEAP
jgi:VCBS repeat-containing protein